MRPRAEVKLWLTMATLISCPPREATLPLGYLTAEERRAFDAWERSIEITREEWERTAAAERYKGCPPMIEVIIEGLLSREDSKSAQEAGWALATLWEARKVTKQQLPTEAQALFQ